MKNRKVPVSVIIAIVIFVLALTLDLVTKYVIEAKLGALGSSAPFLPGFINFILVHNDGAAWNVFSGAQILLIVLTFILLLLILIVYIKYILKNKEKSSKLLGISFGLIVGGCCGNLFDRLAFGYVRDFLNFQFINFPVFNIADCCLCVGVLLLIIFLLFFWKEPKKKGEQHTYEKKGELKESDDNRKNKE